MKRPTARTVALALGALVAGTLVPAAAQPAAQSGVQAFSFAAADGDWMPEPPADVNRTVVPANPGKTMRAQAPLLEAATAIQRRAAEAKSDGFTGTAIEDGQLILYWHGKVPAQIADMVAAYSQNIRIAVRAAPYSAALLAGEAKRLSLEPGINGAGALSDFSGIWVGVADAAAAHRAQNLLSPVKVVPRVKASAVPLAWRWDDTEPFWGGGVVEHRSGIWPFYSYSYCTAGFAARRNSDNVEAMTLSHHCGTSQEWHTPNSGLTLGNTSSGVADVDGAYISGRDYGASVYVGPNNSSSGITINGYVIPTEGTLVCYDGGFSGASCNSFVTTILAFEDGIGPGFWTEDAAQEAAAGQGDSGGPVLAGSTGSGLNGIGVITLGDLNTVTTCQGLGDRTCSWRVFNVNLIAALVQQGLTLETVP